MRTQWDTWDGNSSGKAQNCSYSSTCRQMQSFAAPFAGQGYNLVRGFVTTADRPGELDGRTVCWYTAIREIA